MLEKDVLQRQNFYAYCDNNPIMRIDEDGEFWNILIGAGVAWSIDWANEKWGLLGDVKQWFNDL